MIRKIDSDGNITTVAGAGASGFSGDGGPASQAQLNGPTGIAADADGTIYVADTKNQRVRKISLDETITTILDDNAIDQAPAAIALDAGGNLFVKTGSQIQEISASGVVRQVCRRILYPFDYSGLALDNEGNIYLLNSSNLKIVRLSPSGTLTVVADGTNSPTSCDGCPAASVLLNRPLGLAVDQNLNVFIAEYGQGRIRKISPAGIITTVAKTPAPAGVVIDSKGNLYFSDQSLNTVSKVSLQTGEVAPVAGNPTYGCGLPVSSNLALNVRLCRPAGLALDAAGNLYITDSAYGSFESRLISSALLREPE